MNCETIKEKKDFTKEQFAAIEEMAANGFSYSEVSTVISVDLTDKCCTMRAFNNKRSQAYAIYLKGFLKSQLELRQRIFIDAKHGSSPAQALAKKILDDAEFKMNNQ